MRSSPATRPRQRTTRGDARGPRSGRPFRQPRALRVLFIGGTGVISAAAAQRAVAIGHRLTILNRGRGTLHPAPEDAEVLKADMRDVASVRAALGERTFDVVVDFVAFTADQVAADIELFTGRTGQYVFISSASAYQKPPVRLPILESTPLRNHFGSIRGTRSPARICWSGLTARTGPPSPSSGPPIPMTGLRFP